MKIRQKAMLIGTGVVTALVLLSVGVLALKMVFGGFTYVESLNQCSDKVMRSVDPEELRRWAMQMIQEYPCDPRNGQAQIPTNEVPSYLKDIRFRADPLFDAFIDSEGEPHVCVQWYSSWGCNKEILIGSVNMQVEESSQCFLWVPGIYFVSPQVTPGPRITSRFSVPATAGR